MYEQFIMTYEYGYNNSVGKPYNISDLVSGAHADYRHKNYIYTFLDLLAYFDISERELRRELSIHKFSKSVTVSMYNKGTRYCEEIIYELAKRYKFNLIYKYLGKKYIKTIGNSTNYVRERNERN